MVVVCLLEPCMVEEGEIMVRGWTATSAAICSKCSKAATIRSDRAWMQVAGQRQCWRNKYGGSKASKFWILGKDELGVSRIYLSSFPCNRS